MRRVARLGVTVAIVVAAAAGSATAAGTSQQAALTLGSAAASVASPTAIIAAPSIHAGATIADIVLAAEARTQPGAGGKLWRVATSTVWSGEPQLLLVLGAATLGHHRWLRVLLPIRPDGASGWIPAAGAVLLTTRYWVSVDKRARTVAIYRQGRLLHRYLAVVGKPATPTPDGLAAIYEVDPQPDPTGFLGPWALPLTVFSNALFNFGGGPGRVAIHGRDGASLADPLGSARSHGCIRIENSAIDWMASHLVQGTPVQITG